MDQGKSEYYEFLDLTDVDDSERFRLNNTLFPHEQAPPGEPPPPPEPRVWHEGPYVTPEDRGVLLPPVVAPLPLPLYALIHPAPPVTEAASESVVNSGSSLTQTETEFTMSGEAMSPHSNASVQGPQGHMGYPPQQYAVPPPGQGPHMYQMIQPPLSNVYVGNVTANVNVHGYMGHYVPHVPYVQQEHPQEMVRAQHPREYGNRGRRGRGGHKREYTPRPQMPDIVDHQQHPGYHSYIHMPFQPAYYHPGSASHMAQHATGSPLYVTGHMPIYPHPPMYSPYGMMYPPMAIPPDYQMVDQEKLEQDPNQYPHSAGNSEELGTVLIESETGYQNSCPSQVHEMVPDQSEALVSEESVSPNILSVTSVETIPIVLSSQDCSVPQTHMDNIPAVQQDCVYVNNPDNVTAVSVINNIVETVQNNVVSQDNLSEQVESIELSNDTACAHDSVVLTEPVTPQTPLTNIGHLQVSASKSPDKTVTVEEIEHTKQEPLTSTYQKPKGPYVNNKNIVKTVPRKTNVKPLTNATAASLVQQKQSTSQSKLQAQPSQNTIASPVEHKQSNNQQQTNVAPVISQPVPPPSVWTKNKIYQQPDQTKSAQVAPLPEPVSIQPEQIVTDQNDPHNEVKSRKLSTIQITSETTVTMNNVQTTPNINSTASPPASVPAAVTPPAVKSWASLFGGPAKKVTESNNANDHVQTQPSTAPVINRPIAMVSPFDSSPAMPQTLDIEQHAKTGKSDNQHRNQQNNSATFLDDPNLYRMGEFLSKYNLDNRTVSLQPRGLTNRSNYCYINSTLQALVACSPLYNLLKAMPYQTKRGKSTTPITDAMIQLAYEFNPLPPGARLGRREKGQQRRDDCPPDVVCGPTFEPLVIHKMLNGIRPDTFQIEGRQEDAEEFLSCVLNGLNDEMLELMKRVEEPQEKVQITNGNVTNGDNHTEDGDDWKVMGPKNKGSITRRSYFGRSPISDIFRGQLRSRVQRAGDLTTDNVQPFFTLQLDIERAASVKDALELLVGRDQLEGVTCSRTNQEIEAWQQVSLEELPLVLILHLKWFDYKSDGCSKIVKTVEFPIDLKIDSKIMSSKIKYTTKQRQYKLFAVVYHDGKEASKGHYITDVFHVGYGCWIRYDDSTVKAVTESNVLHPRSPRVPYLLYYRRCDTIGPNPTTIPSGRSQH